jgi:phospholipid-translocating ATPase
MSRQLRFKALFSRKAKRQLVNEQAEKEIYRTESTSSYMQKKRKIYINMKPPSSEYDDKGRLIDRSHVPNRIRTAKYTVLSFIPKNLFEQFRNVANLYFLFLVILQCIPLFGVTEPAVSAMPLIVILVITGIKDGIEDLKRNQADQRVNCSKTLTLSHWQNVNVPEDSSAKSPFHILYVFLGFFCTLAGLDNQFTHAYRMSLVKDKPIETVDFDQDKTPLNEVDENHMEEENSNNEYLQVPQPKTTAAGGFYNKVRQRSDTIRSELTNIFKPTATNKKKIYRPGQIPHSVLHRTPKPNYANSRRRPSSIHPNKLKCSDLSAGEPPINNCKVNWQKVQWQDVQVGDYVMIRNDEDVPADIVILSTSEKDNICYVETQNLDGETNLKVRQGLKATGELRSVHECERAFFYFESEPPHANIYQYNGVMRWNIEQAIEEEDEDEEHEEEEEQQQGDGIESTAAPAQPPLSATITATSSVSHQKTEAITYNNLLLRGSVLRNTRWAIGIILFTGDETKIMLNSGKTPSKRSKMAKATNPFVKYICLSIFFLFFMHNHTDVFDVTQVIANFCILAVLCIVSSVLSSVYFYAPGSARFFDFGIEGSSSSFLGFVTFW